MGEWKLAEIAFWYRGDSPAFQADIGRILRLDQAKNKITLVRVTLDGRLEIAYPLQGEGV